MKKLSLRKKLLPIALSLCLAVPFIPGASAVTVDFQQEDAELYYTGAYETSASIRINSNGIAECWGYVYCHPGYTADAVMRLQWLDPYGVWLTYASWYSEGNAANFDWTCAVPKGRTYRVKVVADIYDSDGNKVEVVGATSGSEKY